MLDIRLAHPTDLDGWRAQARMLIARQIRPEEVSWRVGDQSPDLFASPPAPASSGAPGEDAALVVPRRFVELAGTVICHRDPARFSLLYLLVWRIARGERGLLEIAADPAVDRAAAMARAVHRDLHKMKAFVRFRRIDEAGAEHFIAWFEPDHFIVEQAAPFFAKRFAGMAWSILTPDCSAHWSGGRLSFGPGTGKAAMRSDDALEDVWRRYYASIFNPVRLNLKVMKGQMPVKYWKNLPEARLIAPLATAAGSRTQAMLDADPTEPADRLPANRQKQR